MILDDIADLMNSQPARKIARKTGLSRSKVDRMAQGIPFTIDYNVVAAFHRLGYKLELSKIQKK